MSPQAPFPTPPRSSWTGAASCVLVALLLVALGGPASAHGGSTGGTYRSTATGLSEPADGVDVSVSDDGSRITVTTTSAEELTVLGYAGEEFLRLSSDGVWLDTTSATARQAVGDRLVGRSTTGWERVAARGRYTWLDARVGPTFEQDPPEVVAAPGEHHLVERWHVPVRLGARSLSIDGETWWEPVEYSAGLTLALGLGVVVPGLAGAVALVLPRRRGPTAS